MVDATEAGREEDLGGDIVSCDPMRARFGTLGAEGVRNWKEDGGATSFVALKVALLFGLGAIVGAAVLATEIVSLRLCPGTPSKVFFRNPSEVFGLAFEDAGELVEDLIRNDGLGWSLASLSEAAFVMRGAIVGGAVLATAIDSDRLCPGTSRNDLISSALDGATRGALELFSKTIPARKAAALVVRGAISGAMWVLGRGRALKRGFPFCPSLTPSKEDGLDWA